MDIVKIVLISIFVIFTIVYIAMIGSLNLNIAYSDVDKSCDGISSFEDKRNCQSEKQKNMQDDRQNNINTLNIIGVILGILLGVVHTQIIMNLKIDNNIMKILFYLIILIIYIILISLAGTTYSDINSLMNLMLQMQSKPENPDVQTLDSAKWRVAIKPLVPFLCALSITTIGIIINTLSEIVKKPSGYNNVTPSELSSDTTLTSE